MPAVRSSVAHVFSASRYSRLSVTPYATFAPGEADANPGQGSLPRRLAREGHLTLHYCSGTPPVRGENVIPTDGGPIGSHAHGRANELRGPWRPRVSV